MEKKIFSFLIMSLVGLGLGIFLWKFYDCGASLFCYSVTTFSFALTYGISALSLVFFMLFLSPQSFSLWKKFAKWFIPIATLLFIFYKGGDMFSPYPEQVFKWVSILYVAISLSIIVSNSVKKQ